MSPSPEASPQSLLVNLSFLLDKPTGLSNYATNVVPHLQSLNPTLLRSRATEQQFTEQQFKENQATEASTTDTTPKVGKHSPIQEAIAHWVPDNLTAKHGKLGNLRRFIWTQFQLPNIYRTLNSSLLFSPVPEAPLYSRCRSVVVVHDLIPLRFPNRRSPLFPYFRYYIPQVVAQSEHAIANSEATARDVVDWLGIPASKVTTIPLAVDVSRFHPLDIPTLNYFLYIGRHDSHKNLQRTLRAFARVRRRHNVEFWLAGPQDERFTPQLQQLASELGIAEAVKFLSYVPDDELLKLLNQALGFVFPSLWEGFGLPVLEAMACGTPVITSNLSSLPEVTGDAALLVDPLNVDELAAAMESLVVSPSTRSQLKSAGLARVTQFSWTQTGQLTSEVLKQFI
ncbi:MAG: glycosyltransferase family 4 protein [Synechococcus sp.]